MSERIWFQNIESTINQNESVNTKPSLQSLLEEKLNDSKITPDEAKIIQERLKDVLIKTSETRKQWVQLSYDLRSQFQKAINTEADWAIWPWTMEALEKVAQNSEITKISEVTKNSQTSAEIFHNIDKTRESLEKQWVKLSKPENHNIEVTQTPEWFQLKSLEIDTFNDNWVYIDGEKFWNDTWKTFWFNIDSDFSIWEDNYKINSEISHYTTWEELVYNDSWERDWGKTDFSQSTRLDQALLWIEKEIKNHWWDDNSYVKVSVGGWLQYIWDLWMWEVQKKWHEATQVYEHKWLVETDNKWNMVEWTSLFASWTISAQKQLYWSWKNWIFAVWELKAMLSANWDIWENRMVWKFWIKWEYEKYSVEVYWEQNYSSGVNRSNTIHSWLQTWSYLNTKISAKIPFLDDSQISYNLRKDLNWDNHQMTVWFKILFN